MSLFWVEVEDMNISNSVFLLCLEVTYVLPFEPHQQHGVCTVFPVKYMGMSDNASNQANIEQDPPFLQLNAARE